MDDFEKRLKRIEFKLFPESIKTLYTYATKCSSDDCLNHYRITGNINYRENPRLQNINKCKLCGKELIILNVVEYEDIIFED